MIRSSYLKMTHQSLLILSYSLNLFLFLFSQRHMFSFIPLMSLLIIICHRFLFLFHSVSHFVNWDSTVSSFFLTTVLSLYKFIHHLNYHPYTSKFKVLLMPLGIQISEGIFKGDNEKTSHFPVLYVCPPILLHSCNSYSSRNTEAVRSGILWQQSLHATHEGVESYSRLW